MRTEPFEYVKQVSFPDTAGGHRFVPRLWAKAKINHILELIETHGESSELVDQVIALSLRFNILTKYTAFYADPDEDDPDDDATSVNEENSALPDAFSLSQNYPNPFNPRTVIPFELPAGQNSYHVTIKIYDSLGRLVRILISDHMGPGKYEVIWDGRDNESKPVPSGVYFYRIEAGTKYVNTMKMILMR